MPRKLHNALTPISVKNAGPGRHADGGGLYLRVQGGGARSWLFRSLAGGKARDVGLGPAAGSDALSLAQARDKVREFSIMVAKGDAIEGKRAATRRAAANAQAETISRKTFRDVAEAFVDRKEGGWRNAKHRQQWRNTLATYAYPLIGDMPCAAIETPQVLAVLEPIWTTIPETASRVRSRIENVLDAAKVQGIRSGENPARWRGQLDHILSKPGKLNRGHHAALAYADAPSFMADLRRREAVAARALEFAILTASRSGETLGATWGEVDLAAGIWTVPGERMKAGREHVIPLPPRAIEILRAIVPLDTEGRADALLFPANTGGPLSAMAMTMLLRRMHGAELDADRGGWVDRKQGGRLVTVHGFRSAFRDWAGEQTAFAREVVEHALAHQLADKAEAAYQRGTLLAKRRKLMEAWSLYCSTEAAAGGSVTPIRSSAI